jgi:hypothetical protein
MYLSSMTLMPVIPSPTFFRIKKKLKLEPEELYSSVTIVVELSTP